MKKSAGTAQHDPLIAIAGGGGVPLCNSMGTVWTADYLKGTADGITVVKSPALKGFQVLSATPKAAKTTSDEPRRKSAKKAWTKCRHL
jgi:hypothetical protein